MFKKVLIANRGEIALRVARTCRELGMQIVAVYSTEDRDSAVVSYADEAVRIGPAAAKRSYLFIPAIVEAALRTGAEAVHPGYGFLSENADFAEVCRSNGLAFVGPPADVITRLGDKAAARSLMAHAGLPMLPGTHEALPSVTQARQVADRIGYPVILKAAAGGGGRGLCTVREPGELLDGYRETRAVAQVLFGDSRVYLERCLTHARHIEIQIMADQFGDVIHLGARDCSVQRRHQKLVEETPPPHLPAELAAKLEQAAVRGAHRAGYEGVGTFEFLVDGDGAFYFMEVNCRIQVEHPVTEMATGVDIVAEQFRIAAGQRLRYRQQDIEVRGAAIECRINTEDPDRQFLPTPGVLEELALPGGPFVRVDTHGYPGYRVPASYDPLLAKVTVWAPTRPEALDRMDRALGEVRVRGPGVHTTVDLLRDVLAHPLFRSGEHTTSIVDTVLKEGR